jgi:hypothetical protein
MRVYVCVHVHVGVYDHQWCVKYLQTSLIECLPQYTHHTDLQMFAIWLGQGFKLN